MQYTGHSRLISSALISDRWSRQESPVIRAPSSEHWLPALHVQAGAESLKITETIKTNSRWQVGE